MSEAMTQLAHIVPRLLHLGRDVSPDRISFFALRRRHHFEIEKALFWRVALRAVCAMAVVAEGYVAVRLRACGHCGIVHSWLVAGWMLEELGEARRWI
jgi:hypothetical protein